MIHWDHDLSLGFRHATLCGLFPYLSGDFMTNYTMRKCVYISIKTNKAITITSIQNLYSCIICPAQQCTTNHVVLTFAISLIFSVVILIVCCANHASHWPAIVLFPTIIFISLKELFILMGNNRSLTMWQMLSRWHLQSTCLTQKWRNLISMLVLLAQYSLVWCGRAMLDSTSQTSLGSSHNTTQHIGSAHVLL